MIRMRKRSGYNVTRDCAQDLAISFQQLIVIEPSASDLTLHSLLQSATDQQIDKREARRKMNCIDR